MSSFQDFPFEIPETTLFHEVCRRAAREAGTILREKLGTVAFREKKRADLVTEADTAAQERIHAIVSEAFPEHLFLGEETPGANAASFCGPMSERFCWVVDPLDGTTNFVHGVPLFCTSIALVYRGVPICGVIFNPMSEEFFEAERGKGAFLNGNRIQVSAVQRSGESLVAVGFPTDTKADSPDLLAFLTAVPKAQAIRRTGSTAMNLAYVACGRFDAMWGFSTHAWDVAAGVLLVEEAGGTTRNPEGGPFSLQQPKFLSAANEMLLNE